MNFSFNLFNSISKNEKNNRLTQNFINEIKNYLENGKLKNIEKEDITLIDPTFDENKIITKYRDRMYIERSNILNNYSKKTSDKGEMYYIYSKNSKLDDGYNLCICEEGRSHEVIEKDKSELPEGVKIGSVLRKHKEEYVLDYEATKKIEEEINNMKERLLKEQKEFLESKRIEGHIYELSESDKDRVWLFDITENSDEGIEEIDFPIELLQEAEEGNKYIYKNGEYQKY